MDVREKLVELPFDDAILILKEEHKQRADGYTTHLANGGKGDPAEEANIDALAMAISALEKTKWISVNDRLPENEKDVLIRAERKLYGIGKRGSKIASVISMAFHTDGKMNTEQSAYTWETEYLDAEYDEEADAYIIPEGWWESVTYSEAFSAVCDVVTHWMPLPQPPKGE